MPRLLREEQSDFSRGMYDSLAAIRYPQNAARLIQNGRIQPDGNVKRRDGSRRKHSAVINAATGYGAYTFETAGGDTQEIAIFGAIAYMSDDGWATKTQIATGLRQDYYDFATMRVGSSNYLLMANGDTTIKTWDGSTWSTATGAPSGVKYLEVFNQRLYVSGHSGVLVQASKVADFNTWSSPDGLTVQILTHSGDVPTGLFQLGPHLLVFTDQSTSYIDGFGEQTLVVATGATGFSRSVGCVAFRTIRALGDDAVGWLSLRGIEYYSSSTGIVLMTRPIQEFMDTVDFDAIEGSRGRPTACYDPIRQDYLCAVPTGGSRNARTIVVNVYQRGSGWVGAPSVDLKSAASAGGELKFGDGGDGYIAIDASGFGLTADSNGYVSYATDADGADPVIAGADGYIDTYTDDTLPATLYIGPDADGSRVVHSLGYDGFVRKHFGGSYDKDDELSDTTGGEDVTLTLVPRPFVFRSPSQRKRIRVVYVGVIAETQVSVDVAVRAAGTIGSAVTQTIPASNFGQARRSRYMVHGIGDSPQVQITTTDRARIALVSASAELMREPV